jgi:hypothetical protein
VNAGALAAQGEIVFRADSDFVMAQTVVSVCVGLAARGADAVVIHNTAADVGWLSRIRKFEVDMYNFRLAHSAARFSREVSDSIGGYFENITAGEGYDFQNRQMDSGFQTLFCNADGTYLDEPTRLAPVIRKCFLYDRDFPNH